MNCFGRFEALASPVIGNVEVLLAKTADLRDHRLRPRGDVRLDGALLEHGLDDEVGAVEPRVIHGGRDAREHRIGGRLRPLALLDVLREQLRRIGLALFGELRRRVDQHDVHAGQRGHVGDTRAHHARAQHPELADLRARHVRGAHRELVGEALVHEGRADQVARDRVGHEHREVFRLDLEALVERHDRALEDAGQDRGGGRIVVQRLLRDLRARAREETGHRGIREAGPARNLVSLLVPGLHCARRAEQPAPRRGHEVRGRHQLVHEAHLLRLGPRDVAALEQVGQRLRDADQPRHALRAAAARQQADLHLRQADEHLRVVCHHAVVTGEAQLETAAERETVDCRDPRLAAGLDPSQQRLQAAREPLVGLRRRQARTEAAQELGQVVAREEARLARRDDRAPDRGVARDLVDDLRQFGLDFRPEHVHRTARAVHRDQGDAVRVDGQIEVLRHVLDSCPVGARQMRSMIVAVPMPAPTQSVQQRGIEVAALELVERGAEDHRAGRAERMAHRDRPAVHVHLVVRHVHLAHESQHDRGEGLVDLEQVDVLDAHAGALQQLPRHEGRPGQHDRGLRADRRECRVCARAASGPPWCRSACCRSARRPRRPRSRSSSRPCARG